MPKNTQSQELWTDCDILLPEQKAQGNGKCSDMERLTDGEECSIILAYLGEIQNIGIWKQS